MERKKHIGLERFRSRPDGLSRRLRVDRRSAGWRWGLRKECARARSSIRRGVLSSAVDPALDRMALAVVGRVEMWWQATAGPSFGGCVPGRPCPGWCSGSRGGVSGRGSCGRRMPCPRRGPDRGGRVAGLLRCGAREPSPGPARTAAGPRAGRCMRVLRSVVKRSATVSRRSCRRASAGGLVRFRGSTFVEFPV